MLDGVKQTLLIIKMRKYEAQLKGLQQEISDLGVDEEDAIPSSRANALYNEYRIIQKDYLAVVKESKELRAK